MCAGAIVNSRITNVFYGAKSDRSEADVLEKIFNSSALNHKVNVEGGILADECSDMLKKFFKDRR
jgi:tRNA(adenine34) deaminase